MEKLNIHLKVSPDFYHKNPESSNLGRKIISESIEMIDKLGFESFTFKKLAKAINSNESSIYRYFESKHALLVYLISWYWTWIEYKIILVTLNIKDIRTRLEKVINILTSYHNSDFEFISFNNENLLSKIMNIDSLRVFYTKNIKLKNNKNHLQVYERVVKHASELVLEFNPNFKFPHVLVTTMIEGASQQYLFSPTRRNKQDNESTIILFYQDLILNTLRK